MGLASKILTGVIVASFVLLILYIKYMRNNFVQNCILDQSAHDSFFCESQEEVIENFPFIKNLVKANMEEI
jgi:hypothetical protein